ncbi:uncharacterized protein LOC135216032 [Macrobrachium nipponense]|uniref:uncharacterized protein LOC135216032 n=1 Tax=Macrobrachium nipponense TaxID=159736 RepID=UPI0030C8AF4D
MKLGFVTLALCFMLGLTAVRASPAGGGGGESGHEEEGPIYVRQEKLGGLFLRGLGLQKFFGMFNLHGFGGYAGKGYERGFPYGKPFGHGPRIPHVPEIYNYGPLIPLELIPEKEKVAKRPKKPLGPVQWVGGLSPFERGHGPSAGGHGLPAGEHRRSGHRPSAGGHRPSAGGYRPFA